MIAALLLAGWGAAAEPVTGLAWRWEVGQTRRYHLSAAVDDVLVMPFMAALNTDLQIAGYGVNLIVACTARSKAGKTGWEVRCDIEDASLSVAPLNNSAERCGPVIEQWEKAWEDRAVVQLQLDTRGRMKSFDVDGLDEGIDRAQVIVTIMKVVLGRAFAGFDLPFPADGTDGGVGAWLIPQTAMFAMPSTNGTLGTGEVTAQVLASQAGKTVFSIVGKGTLANGSEPVEGQLSNMVAGTLEGSGVFDATSGALVQVQALLLGRATASSLQVTSSGAPVFRSSITLSEIPAGAKAPRLPASREVSGFLVPLPE